MAQTSAERSASGSGFYLNPTEQDLLLAALNSNRPAASLHMASANQLQDPVYPLGSSQAGPPSRQASSDQSPLEGTSGSTSALNSAVQDTSALEHELDEAAFDWDTSADLIGGLPTSFDPALMYDLPDPHDKRRKTEGEDDEATENGGGKRQEREGKTGKKPGRKPLTSEPTTKRKAQNRAAQRAFRDRKEKHLKDLETKVDELEKASTVANNENDKLRSEVERLQSEVKEYRTQLSLGPGAAPRAVASSSVVGQPYSSKANWDISSSFQFEFPRFGLNTTANHEPSRSPLVDGTGSNPTLPVTMSARNGLLTSSPSPLEQRTNDLETATRLSSNGTGPSSVDDFVTLFSPSTNSSTGGGSSELKYTPVMSTAASTQDTKGLSRQMPPEARRSATSNSSQSRQPTFDSVSASPASPGSNAGLNSSAVTTPDSLVESPDQRKASEAAFQTLSKSNALPPLNNDGTTIASSLSPNAGMKNTTLPLAFYPEGFSAAATEGNALNQPVTPGDLALQNLDWLTTQNGGTFDPILFGSWRDPQENIMNAPDVTDAIDYDVFFKGALPPSSVSDGVSPVATATATAAATTTTTTATTIEPPPSKLMQAVEAAQDANDMPNDGLEVPLEMIPCETLRSRMQQSEKYKAGELDMDDLCTQLRAKARCNGSGPVILKTDMDLILGPKVKAEQLASEVKP